MFYGTWSYFADACSRALLVVVGREKDVQKNNKIVIQVRSY